GDSTEGSQNGRVSRRGSTGEPISGPPRSGSDGTRRYCTHWTCGRRPPGGLNFFRGSPGSPAAYRPHPLPGPRKNSSLSSNMLRAIVIAFTLLAVAPPAGADVRLVRAGDNLQAAINSAQPGDELRLEAGATFTGNFALPVTSGSSLITIRTDLPDSALPASNQ